jgi:ADP-ribose pyrophosphatase
MTTNEYPEQPQVAVGAIVIREGKVLLVKRNQPPGDGLWAIPGGRVNLGESLKQAAEREIKEETGVTIDAREPIYTFEVINEDNSGIRFHYVIIDLVADYVSGEPCPGDDASEARWVSPDELTRLPVSQSTIDVLKDVMHFSS